MPAIDNFLCDNCKIKLSSGWGYYMYVEDDEGKRITCHHPCEWLTYKQVLPQNFSNCVYLECLHQFVADFGEDYGTRSRFPPFVIPLDSMFELHRIKRQEKNKRECPKCNSINVKTELELVGEICPKCKRGVIEQRFSGKIVECLMLVVLDSIGLVNQL